MNPKIVNFIKAFLALEPSEKREILALIKTLDSGREPDTIRLLESLGLESAGATTINFAPAPGACPTCGK